MTAVPPESFAMLMLATVPAAIADEAVRPLVELRDSMMEHAELCLRKCDAGLPTISSCKEVVMKLPAFLSHVYGSSCPASTKACAMLLFGIVALRALAIRSAEAIDSEPSVANKWQSGLLLVSHACSESLSISGSHTGGNALQLALVSETVRALDTLGSGLKRGDSDDDSEETAVDGSADDLAESLGQLAIDSQTAAIPGMSTTPPAAKCSYCVGTEMFAGAMESLGINNAGDGSSLIYALILAGCCRLIEHNCALRLCTCGKKTTAITSLSLLERAKAFVETVKNVPGTTPIDVVYLHSVAESLSQLAAVSVICGRRDLREVFLRAAVRLPPHEAIGAHISFAETSLLAGGQVKSDAKHDSGASSGFAENISKVLAATAALKAATDKSGAAGFHWVVSDVDGASCSLAGLTSCLPASAPLREALQRLLDMVSPASSPQLPTYLVAVAHAAGSYCASSVPLNTVKGVDSAQDHADAAVKCWKRVLKDHDCDQRTSGLPSRLPGGWWAILYELVCTHLTAGRLWQARGDWLRAGAHFEEAQSLCFRVCLNGSESEALGVTLHDEVQAAAVRHMVLYRKDGVVESELPALARWFLVDADIAAFSPLPAAPASKPPLKSALKGSTKPPTAASSATVTRQLPWPLLAKIWRAAQASIIFCEVAFYSDSTLPPMVGEHLAAAIPRLVAAEQALKLTTELLYVDGAAREPVAPMATAAQDTLQLVRLALGRLDITTGHHIPAAVSSVRWGASNPYTPQWRHCIGARLWNLHASSASSLHRMARAQTLLESPLLQGGFSVWQCYFLLLLVLLQTLTSSEIRLGPQLPLRQLCPLHWCVAYALRPLLIRTAVINPLYAGRWHRCGLVATTYICECVKRSFTQRSIVVNPLQVGLTTCFKALHLVRADASQSMTADTLSRRDILVRLIAADVARLGTISQ
jgi:hypothetical protein